MPAHCHFNTMLSRFLCVAFGAWRDLRFSRRTCRDEFDRAWPSGSGHDFFCFSRFFPVDRGNHSIRLEGALNSCEKGRIVLLGVERKIIADGGEAVKLHLFGMHRLSYQPGSIGGRVGAQPLLT